MINGFEQETSPLTDYEREVILPVLVKHLPKKVGKQMAVTNKRIVEGLGNGGIKTSAPRIRKIINYIRVNRLIANLMATSKGYYVSNNYEEIADYIESLKQREAAIRAVRESFSNQLKL